MPATLNTTQAAAPASVLRPLGAFERFFYFVDQISPAHFSVTAQIGGQISVAAWRAALMSLQARHPLFSACIDADHEWGFYLRRVP